MAFTWTEEKEALFRFDTDTLVSASAGTGKTTALVELFVRLLQGRTEYPLELTAENILAITFTNKAAREMRERIAKGVQGRLPHTRFDDVIQAATISTFHSFCATLLREYAFEANLAPDFELLDEFDVVIRREQAILAELGEGVARRDPDCMRLLAVKKVGQLKESITRILTTSYAPDLEEPDVAAETARIEAQLRQVYRDYDTHVRQIAACDYMLANPTTNALEGLERYKGHWKAFYKYASPVSAHDELGDGLQRFSEWEGVLKTWARRSKKIEPTYAETKALFAQAYNLFCDAKSLPDRLALTRLAKRCFARYDSAKRAAFAMDFQDLQRETIRLLKARPAIRDSLLRRFHVILVDEFQDTNRTQVELLNLIQRGRNDATRLGLPPARRLLVGDRKQSIYRFRGADVSVFRSIERDMLDGAIGGKRIHFTENFRSQSNLLRVFNGLFPMVMAGDGEADYEVAYETGDDLKPGLGRFTADTLERLPAEVIVNETSGENMPQKRHNEANALAARIREICSPDGDFRWLDTNGNTIRPTYGDICILMRRMTHAGYYEDALRQVGIPYTIGQSSGFLKRREVKDLVALLEFIAQPLKPIPRYAVLRGPAGMLSDFGLFKVGRIDARLWLPQNFAPERILAAAEQHGMQAEDRLQLAAFLSALEEIYRRMPVMPIAELVELVVARFDLRLFWSMRADAMRVLANLDKFLNLVRGWQESISGFDLTACVERLAQMKRLDKREPEGAPDPAMAAVRIMTIHQAKGLEFPVVLLPDMSNKSKANPRDTFVSDGRRIGMKLFYGGEQQSIDTFASTHGMEAENNKEGAEYQRLLYVALTRAKHYLILSGDVPEKPPKAAKPSWLDWFIAYADSQPGRIPIQRAGDIAARSEGDLDGQGADLATANRLPPAADAIVRRHAPEIMGTYSISLLSELNRCERAFVLRQLLDKSTLLWMEDEPEQLPVLGERPGELEIGIWVHRYFEVQPDGMKAGAEGWRQFLQVRGVDAESEWASQVGNYIERCGDFPPQWQVINARRELPFIARLDLPSGRALRLKGKVDAVGEDAEGRLVLVDYKYARRRAEHEAGYLFQLRAYAAVLSQADANMPPIEAYLAYLKEDEPWTPVSLAKEDLVAFYIRLDDTMGRIAALKGQSAQDLAATAHCESGKCRFEKFCNDVIRT